jgi:transposase-like protein
MSLPKIYSDESTARKHLENLLWPEGPFCPHCGNSHPDRIHKLKGKSTRPGVYKCRECEKPFSVTVGTVFESSHVPLHKWVYATHLLTASKKGISSHQLMRMLDVSYKTAWFMSHRIREAMRVGGSGLLGGEGRIVEGDETYFGQQENPKSPRPSVPTRLNAVLAPLVSVASSRLSSAAVKCAHSILPPPMAFMLMR